jgi:hypothetical protein
VVGWSQRRIEHARQPDRRKDEGATHPRSRGGEQRRDIDVREILGMGHLWVEADGKHLEPKPAPPSE